MDVIAARLRQQYPDSNEDHYVNVTPMHEQIVKRVRSALFIFLTAVGFVLLVACANVANLLLARATAVKNMKSAEDRKSTRLNSSHQIISYAVFCLKKK